MFSVSVTFYSRSSSLRENDWFGLGLIKCDMVRRGNITFRKHKIVLCEANLASVTKRGSEGSWAEG